MTTPAGTGTAHNQAGEQASGQPIKQAIPGATPAAGGGAGTALAASVRMIERAGGSIATASVSRMDETLPWFRELPADQRAWVMLVAQAGVRSLVEWLRHRDEAGIEGTQEVSDEGFDAAPRALARSLNL